ncbi:MAG: putative inorganic carbon transporter subunit DabA [Acidimicrobiia bacterium]
MPGVAYTCCERRRGRGGATATVTAADDRRLAHHVRRVEVVQDGCDLLLQLRGPGRPRRICPSSSPTAPAAPARWPTPTPRACTAPPPRSCALGRRARHRRQGADGGGVLCGCRSRGLAPLVVLVGHGASTVNNPYATGLDRGAGGGHSGAIERAGRDGAERTRGAGRARPAGHRYPRHHLVRGRAARHHHRRPHRVRRRRACHAPRHAVATFAAHAADAARAARWERAPRLGITTDPHTSDDVDELVRSRSRDWAQVRPEWGLAGCRAFVAAPRDLTRHLDLGGRAFLHSYDHTLDTDHSVLELIMTAPMVVASWISLQYHASTVDNAHHGSGDKTLHNVIGRLGVLEGNGGDLRTGLPLQSVHDGEHAAHEPLRLAVVIAAPRDAIDGVLAHHADVRALIEHEWVHLLTMSDNGRITHRRTAQGWVAAPASTAPAGQGA